MGETRSAPRFKTPARYPGSDMISLKRFWIGSSLEITCPASYVIDGEFFDGPTGGPLKVETGPIFIYLCG